jgi:hypothetical protein
MIKDAAHLQELLENHLPLCRTRVDFSQNLSTFLGNIDALSLLIEDPDGNNKLYFN